MANEVLSDRSYGGAGAALVLELRGGGEHETRGVVARLRQSPGQVVSSFSKSGWQCWIPLPARHDEIEAVQTGERRAAARDPPRGNRRAAKPVRPQDPAAFAFGDDAMTAVTITPSADFARAARALNERQTRRMILKGINAAGKTFRTDLPSALESQLKARKIKSRSKARAAYAGSTKPRYTLRMPRFVPVHDVKTLTFKRRGKGRQARRLMAQFRDFDRSVVRFGNVRREGRGAQRKIKLLKAPGLPERNVGAIQIPKSILDDKSKFASVQPIPGRAREAAVVAMGKEITKALASRR